MLLAGCVAAWPPGSIAASVPAGAISESSLDSGVALYLKIAAAEPGNIALSPVSLLGAMAPVAAGARGETRAAIGKAMDFSAGDVLTPTGAMLRSLSEKRDGGRVDIANALWLARDLTPDPAFVEATRGALGSTVERVDFSQAAAAAAKINQWAADKTEGRVSHVIDPPFDRTRLVITNAVYLLADWADGFDAEDTRTSDFFAAAGTVQAPLMNRIGSYRLIEDSDAQIVDLPYRDGRLALSLILPKGRNGLAALERKLSADWFERRLAALDAAPPQSVEVTIPKVEFNRSVSLKQALTAMGMGIAFSDAADLSGIANERLSIGRVLQSSFLKIDEKGTEAAAVTAIDIVVVGARMHQGASFRADHPFLFVLRDKPTGALLFIGRIADPTAR